MQSLLHTSKKPEIIQISEANIKGCLKNKLGKNYLMLKLNWIFLADYVTALILSTRCTICRRAVCSLQRWWRGRSQPRSLSRAAVWWPHFEYWGYQWPHHTLTLTTGFGYHSLRLSLSLFSSQTHTLTHSSIVRSVSLPVLIGGMWFLLNTYQPHTWCAVLTDKPTICLW